LEAIQTKLVGVSFGNCQRNIKLLGNPGINIFDLKREPNNPHDPNAIWVGFGKFEMGYLPKNVAKKIAPYMDNGKKLAAEFVSLNQMPNQELIGMTVKITELTN